MASKPRIPRLHLLWKSWITFLFGKEKKNAHKGWGISFSAYTFILQLAFQDSFSLTGILGACVQELQERKHWCHQQLSLFHPIFFCIKGLAEFSF